MPIVLLLGFLSRIDRAREAAQHDYMVNDATISVELLSPVPREPARVEPPTASMGMAEAAEAPPAEENPTVGSEELGTEPSLMDDEGEEAAEPEASLGELAGEPNVTLLLWLAPMREQKLAPTLRRMLGCGKLGASLRRAEVDAFDDIEAGIFSASRLDDPRQYTAALSHHLPPARLQKALSRLTWPGGRWLDEDAVRARAAGATRVVFRRGANLVLVTPEPVWKKVKESSRPMRLPSSTGRALSLTLREPSMALARLGLDVPASLSRMRLEVFPQPTGDIELRLRFEDRDEAEARANAPRIAAEIDDALRQFRQVAALSKLFAPLVGGDVDVPLPRFDFAVEGSAILSRARLHEAQVAALLAKLAPLVCETGRAGEVITGSRHP